jgi:hypothetical protein
MGKILSVKKVSKGSINLDDSILDYLFVNEGDYIAFVEENNKIYIRKTRKPQETSDKTENEVPPPPTFEEKTAEFSGTPNIAGNNIFDAVQDALKNPETMKMFQDTAKQLFSALGDIGKVVDPTKTKKDSKNNSDENKESDNDTTDDEDFDDDEDSDDEGFQVKID